MMARVAIIGSSGAGKSTLAGRLGEILALPVHHLDSYYWMPGWQPREREAWDKLHATLLAPAQWIIDGNYGRLMAARLAVADTIVWMDFPRHICLARAVRRWVRYAGRKRPDMGEGCPEKMDWEFIQWIWDFPRRSRPAIVARLESCGAEKQIIVFRRPPEVQRWLNRVQRTAEGGKTRRPTSRAGR